MTLGEFFNAEYTKVTTIVAEAEASTVGQDVEHFLSNPEQTKEQVNAIVSKLIDEVAAAGNDYVTISGELKSQVLALVALVQAHPAAPVTPAA